MERKDGSEEPRIAKAGKLVCVDSGEYSDYSVRGFFVVLRDFDPYAELADYLSEHPEQKQNYRFAEDKFLALLLSKGFLMEVDFGTMHLTCYSNHEEFSFTPAAESN